MTFLAILAGFFAGAASVLVYLHVKSLADIKVLNTERMLLLNKAFIRDGQVPLFSPQTVGQEPDTPPAPRKIVSPFQAGLDRARAKVDERPSSNLPPSVEQSINKAAEEARRA